MARVAGRGRIGRGSRQVSIGRRSRQRYCAGRYIIGMGSRQGKQAGVAGRFGVSGTRHG